jgi:hypothetical protein
VVQLEENDEYSEDPLEVELDDIEGKDPARARFIRGYLKAQI